MTHRILWLFGQVSWEIEFIEVHSSALTGRLDLIHYAVCINDRLSFSWIGLSHVLRTNNNFCWLVSCSEKRRIKLQGKCFIAKNVIKPRCESTHVFVLLVPLSVWVEGIATLYGAFPKIFFMTFLTPRVAFPSFTPPNQPQILNWAVALFTIRSFLTSHN